MEENKQHVNEDIYSKVLRAGRRTYFFDVRSTKAGDYYLTLTISGHNIHNAFLMWTQFHNKRFTLHIIS